MVHQNGHFIYCCIDSKQGQQVTLPDIHVPFIVGRVGSAVNAANPEGGRGDIAVDILKGQHNPVPRTDIHFIGQLLPDQDGIAAHRFKIVAFGKGFLKVGGAVLPCGINAEDLDT